MNLRLNAESTTEVHFEFFGGPIPGIIAPMDRPAPPFDATLREGGGWVPELFECTVWPHKQIDEVDLHRYSGSITVTLRTRATEGSPANIKKWTILFFNNRKEIWMDGKFWNIDDTFWKWMNRKFAFSGIDIHLTADCSSQRFHGPDKPPPVGARAWSGPCINGRGPKHCMTILARTMLSGDISGSYDGYEFTPPAAGACPGTPPAMRSA